MANDKYAFMSQVTITSANNRIDVDLNPGGAPDVRNVTITAQDYDDMWAVVTALETALQVQDGTFTVDIGSTGTVTIARTGNFTIQWTGANTIGTVLGYDITVDDSGAATYDSDYQHMYAFYPDDPCKYDSRNRPRVMGPATFVANDGTCERTTFATHYPRIIDLEYISKEKYYAAHADTNEDYETWWIASAEGLPFSVFSDTDLWTDEGVFCFVSPQDIDLLNDPRISESLEYMSTKLVIQRQP